MKVYELAKEIGITNKELIERLKGHNVHVTSHMATLDIDAIFLIKKDFLKMPRPAAKKPVVKKPAAKKPAAETKKEPAAEKPKRAVKKAAPVKKEPVAKQPAAKEHVVKTAAAKAPVAKEQPAKEHVVKVHPAAPEPALPKPAAPVVPAAPAHIVHKPVEVKKEHPVAHAHAPAAPAKPAVAHHAPPVRPAAPVVKHHGPSVKPAATPVVEPPKPAPVVDVEPKNDIELTLPITVKDLSIKLQEKPSVIIKRLMDMRIMAGINQFLDEQAVEQICRKYGFRVKKALGVEETLLTNHAKETVEGVLKQRPPVVTFMGHVDHGKTSLLDAIRRSKVAETEHGGITQHIGAYEVILPKGSISFLDTPGHEAFTAMRARGAKITDIVVLVVAADDGIMPQTIEAIDHAKEAKVPIIVAINKIDKPAANVDKIKKQLMEHGLTPEDWSGQTITVPVSAKSGAGIQDLLEMILLQAEVLELKANYEKLASGVVVEGRMDKQRGPIATMLIQSGTLHLNDHIIVGGHYGKVRALFSDRGVALTEATPSRPVEVMGINGVVQAGEQFFAVEDEKKAKEIAADRAEKEKLSQVKTIKRISLDDLHVQIQEGIVKELKIILKADVSGSLEAIKESLKKLNISEIQLNVIHEGTGTINGSDIILATASDALVIGFHVDADDRAKELVEKEGVDVRLYNVIYELNNDLKAAVEGMLEPKIKKVFLGRAEARKVFKLSSSGVVAGSMVTKGKILRNSEVRVLRGEEVVYEGKISALKRFKDDVKEVAEGFECGISLVNFQAIMEGDLIEAFEIQKISRKL